jgi:ABC-type antimicrobial peptide transport system permease subunit
VSFESVVPLSGSTVTDDYHSPLSHGDQQLYVNLVAPSYFATMHIPMLLGRDFRWDDSNASGQKIILNRSAAKTLFPGRDALGQTLYGYDKNQYQVIAVVGDVHYLSIRESAPPAAYRPITQWTVGNAEAAPSAPRKPSYSAVVRIAGPAASFAAAARTLASRVGTDIPAPAMTSMVTQLNDSISSERMMATLAVFFAACALLVTAIGLYGTLAYATARRTSEIGIRMALGAQRTQVIALVFRENAWVAAFGCFAGLSAALFASRLLASFLYGTSAHDPWVLAASVTALLAIASAASLLPAIRAARIEPMQALRAE